MRPVVAPGWTGDPKRDVKIIDCDVHHNISKPEDLLPYLPKAHRESFLDQGLMTPSTGFFNVPFRKVRTDLSDGDDSKVFDPRDRCSSYEMLRDEHMDLWNVDIGILTGPPFFYSMCALPDPDYAAALCRAMNDFTLEHWTGRDKRLKATICVSTSDPIQAAAEVDRVGERDDVVGVIVPTGSQRPYGFRFYHPIWKACNRHKLAVVVHPGAIGTGTHAPPTAAGYPTYYMEERMARPSQASAHCASFVIEGVFEKYPDLQVGFVEVQQAWLISLLWHLDADWKMLRDQTPWLKKLPSEYIRKHVKVGSQPIHQPPKEEQLLQMFEQMHAEDTLVYCSAFPHYDWDDPHTVFPKIHASLRRRIFQDNALELFGLSVS